jgi:hypothetical protein
MQNPYEGADRRCTNMWIKTERETLLMTPSVHCTWTVFIDILHKQANGHEYSCLKTSLLCSSQYIFVRSL